MDVKHKRGLSKIIIAIVISVLGYLFALNGRYEPVGSNNSNTIIFDKWTRKALLPDDYIEID